MKREEIFQKAQEFVKENGYKGFDTYGGHSVLADFAIASYLPLSEAIEELDKVASYNSNLPEAVEAAIVEVVRLGLGNSA